MTDIPTQFFGTQGAGVLLIAKNTGRVLLVLRSSEVLDPHVWGMPGGKIDSENETPNAAAKREVKEEVGYEGSMTLMPDYLFVDAKSGFKYHNFIGLVEKEFTPKTDWENDDARWFELDNLPNPLHFGFQLMLNNSLVIIKKMIEICIKPYSSTTL